MSYILTNGNIYTVNPKQPRASAMAVVHDRIVAIGSDEEIKAIQLPNATHIDLKGAFVMPGMIDAHLHLEWTGLAMKRINLMDVPSKAQALAIVKAAADKAKPGEWLLGRGFQHNDWGSPEFPTAADLDAVAPDNPVALSARSGHGMWVNTAALHACGITAYTPNPPGGEIVHNASGAPSGMLLETALQLVNQHVPPLTPEQEEEAVIDVMREMNLVGLTGAHCMDGLGGMQTFSTYQRLHQQGKLSLRIVKQLPVEDLDTVIGLGLRSGFGDSWLRIGGIKIFIDGALGQRTAAMLSPYVNDGDNCGLPTFEKEELFDVTVRCAKANFCIVVHAIGDRANRDVLDAIENCQKILGPLPHLRHRIEHTQHLDAADIPRFAQLGVIASPQPIHCTSDMPMSLKLLGESRSKLSYAWRSLLNSGTKLAFGSDAPVEPFDPFLGLYAAVTRRRADGSPGPDGWQPEQRLSIEEAIYGYTMGAAYAGGSEREVGSLEAGKLADFVVLSQDLTAIAPEQILKTKVERVMVGGEFKI
ncbi:MAG: amidohydrolase [Anaerolineae bacterium]|nr:amidohydrolase [Anaerolineae bacterium]